ncbi:hypothetical protein SK128_025468 [Halocaridina rubra]|uniref:Uncharacterized protein n=1 Tax=Halocaridina rubra TaxID=373956 RepID=A0AAN8X487_HALRR
MNLTSLSSPWWIVLLPRKRNRMTIHESDIPSNPLVDNIIAQETQPNDYPCTMDPQTDRLQYSCRVEKWRPRKRERGIDSPWFVPLFKADFAFGHCDTQNSVQYKHLTISEKRANENIYSLSSYIQNKKNIA